MLDAFGAGLPVAFGLVLLVVGALFLTVVVLVFRSSTGQVEGDLPFDVGRCRLVLVVRLPVGCGLPRPGGCWLLLRGVPVRLLVGGAGVVITSRGRGLAVVGAVGRGLTLRVDGCPGGFVVAALVFFGAGLGGAGALHRVVAVTSRGDVDRVDAAAS